MHYQLELLKAGDLSRFRDILLGNQLPVHDLHNELQLFVWRQDGTIIGTGGLEVKAPHALLRSVSLVENARGHGNGRRLLAALEEEARRRGVQELYLLTTTAEKFFGHLGYGVISREQAPIVIRQTTEFASVCPASAVCMKKRIT